MDDIIPFLIVVAIAIIGAVSRKKKSPANDPSEARRPFRTSNDNLLRWMEEEFMDEKPESSNRPSPFTEVKEEAKAEKVQPEVVVSSPAPAPANKFSLYNGFISPEETESIKQNEGQSVTKASAILDENDLTHKGKKQQGTPSSMLDFDLRRAVIFSEILNRKYE
jgi:hypothetical protein